MGLVDMVMPSMGEGIMEATVLSWLKNVGDTIEQDESVLEVATDKVDTEVPATYDGVIEELLVNEGDVVEVGKPVARVRVSQEEGGNSNSNSIDSPQAELAPALVAEAPHINGYESKNHPLNTAASDRFYSPLVKSIAKTENISLQELKMKMVKLPADI